MRSDSRQSRVAALQVLIGASMLLLAPGAATAQEGVYPDSEWTDTLMVSTSGHTAEFNVIPPSGTFGDDVQVSCWGMPCSFVNGQSADTIAMYGSMDHYIDVDFSTPSQDGDRTLYMGATALSGPSFTDNGTRIYTLDGPPVADFDISNTHPNVGEFVTFTSTSTDEVGGIIDYHWWFGDGEDASGSSLDQTSHSYTVADTGTVEISLKVTDSAQLTDSTSMTLVVNSPPVASFNQDPAFPSEGQTVTFTSTSSDSDGTISSYQWDFGDSSSDTGSQVDHIYSSSGSYYVTLTVTDDDGSTDVVGDSVTVGDSPIVLSVDDANPGLEEVRSECVTAAAGPGRIECDDFVYHYAFTPVIRMNRPYELGLFYNSAHAHPRKLVGANFILPSSEVEPDEITATLSTAGNTSTTWADSQYDRDENTRLSVEWSDGAATSGPVDYTMELKTFVNSQQEGVTSEDGRFLVVHRDSPLGHGWWLAGLEQLEIQSSLELMWIGGDGSTRLYSRTSTNDPFVSQTRSRPDTIVESGSEYHRHLIGGGQVVFNSAGRHIETESRTGVLTEFMWTGTGADRRVDAVKVEGETLYDLDYATSPVRLSKVKVLSKSGGWDEYDVTTDGSSMTISSITTPDNRTVDFGYRSSDAAMDTIQTEPAASETVTTALTYEHGKVREVKTTASGLDDLVIDYEAASARGVDESGAPYALELADSVSAYVNGPRTDTTVTRFFVTGWGAVRGIRDALDNETWITRADGAYPALPTKVEHPNGWIVTAEYHPNGLLKSTTDSSTVATTSYEWDDDWSRPTKITSPEGVVTEMRYDADGNRDTLFVDADTVSFAYNADNQVSSITDAEGNVRILEYDGNGNLKLDSLDMADGPWTRYDRSGDARGYPAKVTRPTGTGTQTAVVETTYDALGRVIQDSTSTSADEMWQRTEHSYDPYSGWKTETEAFGFTPDTTDADSTVSNGATQWTYDLFGRVIVEDHPAARDSMVHDRSGNVIERYRDSDTLAITMEYDALNRVSSRSVPQKSYSAQTIYGYTFPHYASSGLDIPADTAVFTFDEMGNLESADNDYAQISRTYYPNGRLKTDTLAIREYGGSSFTTHVYGVQHTYNKDGQRTEIHHPAWLSSGSGKTEYTFDPNSGRLSTITDAQDNDYGFQYNGNGQPELLSYPTGADTLTYDAAGRVTSVAGPLKDESITYDRGGRIATGSTLYAYGGDSDFTYNGFGHLVESDLGSGKGALHREFHRDAFGNAVFEHGFPPDKLPSNSPGSARSLDYANARLSSTEAEWVFDQHPDEPDNWQIDAIGGSLRVYDGRDLVRISTDSPVWAYVGSPDPYDEAKLLANHVTRAKSYYSADGKLMVHQVTRDSIDHDVEPPDTATAGDPWGAYEEYWYDALGRRILKRSRQESPLCTFNGSGDRCYSSTERYVWDGDQLLWELRWSSVYEDDPSGSAYTGQTGNIGYVHAGGIDAPLGMVRNDSTIALHRGWRGAYLGATKASGTQIATDVPWPGIYWEVKKSLIDPREVHTWMGSLAMGHTDHSGLIYQRNRYYDPESGQFTQSDPIGLAGGLNLYGYANGDPVNFTDPFGLRAGQGECDGIEDEDEKAKCEEEQKDEEDKEGGWNQDGAAEDGGLLTRACGAAVGSFALSVATDYLGWKLIAGGTRLAIRGSQMLETANRLQQIPGARAATRQATRSLGITGYFSQSAGRGLAAGGVAIQAPQSGLPGASSWDFVPILGSGYRGYMAAVTCF